MENELLHQEDILMKANLIIHSSATLAAGIGGGLAQFPGSDSIPLVGVQTAMVIALGNLFNVPIEEEAAIAIVATGTASFVGRMISQFVIGWIPGVGNGVNATTAGGITEALGWKVYNDFKNKYYR